jgi:hypothetical protein
LEKHDFLYTYFCGTAGIAAFDFTNPDFVSFLTSGILPPSCTSHDPSTSYCLNRYLKIGEPFIPQNGIFKEPRELGLFQSYKVLENVVEKEKTGKETKVKSMKLDIIGIVLALLQNGVPNDTIWKNLSPFDYNLPGIELQQDEQKRLQSDKVKVLQNYNRFGKKYEQTMDERGKARLLKQFEAYMVSKTEEQQLLPKDFTYPNFLKQVQKQRIKLAASLTRPLSQEKPSKQRTTLLDIYNGSHGRDDKDQIDTGKRQRHILGQFIQHGGIMQRSVKDDFMRFSKIISENMLTFNKINLVNFFRVQMIYKRKQHNNLSL